MALQQRNPANTGWIPVSYGAPISITDGTNSISNSTSLTFSRGIISGSSGAATYTPALATTTTFGEIKVGSGLSISSGTISAPVMIGSGTSHAAGLVPDPGATAGTTRFLREDGTFAVPPSGSSSTLPTDYISGLVPYYVSATAIGVGTGSAYVPAASAIVTVSTALTNTPTLAANTIYYIYLTGTGTLLISTTSPTTNYQGTAWQNASGYRYLRAFLTNGSSQIYNFIWYGDTLRYRAATSSSAFLVLNSGNASSSTSISCAALVPTTASVIISNLTMSGTGGAYFGSASGFTPTVGSGDLYVSESSSVNVTSYAEMNVTSAAFLYCTVSGFTITIHVIGYKEER